LAIHARVVELVGDRKRVLDVGCGTGVLSRALAQHQCDIVGIDRDPLAVEEARQVCTHAFVADLDTTTVAEVAGDRSFDAIVLSDVLERLREPMRVLDDCRALLSEGGCVVASLRNAAHGSLRLANLAGIYASTAFDTRSALFTAKSLEELFVGAGFKIERIEKTTAPIDRADFSDDVVAEIRRDAEVETLAFVVRATPLSNEAKYRAITKRFLVANSELETTKALLARRERELERLRTRAETSPGPVLSTVSPPSDRQRQLMDGLRRSLDEAVAQYDRVSIHEAELQRQLDKTIQTRDAIAAKHEEILGVLKIAVDDRNAARAQVEQEKQRTAAVRAELANADARLVASQEKLATLEAETLTAWERLESAEAARDAALDSVLTMGSEIEGLRERTDDFASRLFTAREESRAERVRTQEVDAKLAAANLEVARLKSACEAESRKTVELRAQIHETEVRVAAQLDALAAAAEAESRETSKMIDLIQGGVTWKLKRLIDRVLGRGR
jgi:SAM-dependent methyltransferase